MIRIWGIKSSNDIFWKIFIHCSWCNYWSRICLYHVISFILKPSAVAENVFSLTLNVGWKCHFQFSQLSQLHEWNFFQLSEWKNYCHFLWLSIYLLLHSINLYTPKTFSARVISKSNFFQLGNTSWLPHVVEILLLGFSFCTWKISKLKLSVKLTIIS